MTLLWINYPSFLLAAALIGDSNCISLFETDRRVECA